MGSCKPRWFNSQLSGLTLESLNNWGESALFSLTTVIIMVRLAILLKTVHPISKYFHLTVFLTSKSDQRQFSLYNIHNCQKKKFWEWIKWSLKRNTTKILISLRRRTESVWGINQLKQSSINFCMWIIWDNHYRCYRYLTPYSLSHTDSH